MGFLDINPFLKNPAHSHEQLGGHKSGRLLAEKHAEGEEGGEVSACVEG
jgi:hypothetical protein